MFATLHFYVIMSQRIRLIGKKTFLYCSSTVHLSIKLPISEYNHVENGLAQRIERTMHIKIVRVWTGVLFLDVAVYPAEHWLQSRDTSC